MVRGEEIQQELPATAGALFIELTSQRAYNVELLAQNQQLRHENLLLMRKLYGVRTEQTATVEQQALFTELAAENAAVAEALATAALAAAERRAERQPTKAPAKPTGRRDLSTSKLPRIEVEIASAALDAAGVPRIGVDETYELAAQKATYVVIVKKTVRYAQTEVTAEATTVSAVAPPRVCKGSLFHESMLAKILTEKFALGTTLYRLEKHMASQEVAIDRGTMARLIEHVGNTLAVSIVAAMFAHAKATAHVISTDATGAWILPEPSQVSPPLRQRCDKGHFFTAVIDADAILFFYERDHTQAAVEKLFAGFGGYLQADASSVYHLLERGPHDPPEGDDDDVTLVGCFAHCRRYFFDAAQCRYAEGARGLALLAAIFAADKPLWKKSAAERQTERLRVLAPLVDAFFGWVKATRAALPFAQRNLLTRALGYASNQEAELRRVLLDPMLPLDNTRAERALRTPVISRKNSLFHGSDTHAEAAAGLFSILQTCRLHGLDMQAYLEEVLRLLPQWPKDRFLELAPNFWKATRARLVPAELARPIGWFTIPPPPL